MILLERPPEFAGLTGIRPALRKQIAPRQRLQDEEHIRVVGIDGRTQTRVDFAKSALLDDEEVSLESRCFRHSAEFLALCQVTVRFIEQSTSPSRPGRLEPTSGILGSVGEITVEVCCSGGEFTTAKSIFSLAPLASNPVSIPPPIAAEWQRDQTEADQYKENSPSFSGRGR